jgi:hypothetical protein
LWDYPAWPKSKLSDTALFRFVVNDRDGAGYIDHSGKVVIPRRFDAAGSFRDGSAEVSAGGRYGYIDRSGKMVIPARFHSASPFSEGLALVIETGFCTRRGYLPCDGWAKPPPSCKYTVIDKTGNVVWRSRYIDAKPYSEGLAAVGDGTKWGFVDKTGALCISL